MIEEARAALAERLNALVLRFSDYQTVSQQLIEMVNRAQLMLEGPISSAELDQLLLGFGCSAKSRRETMMRATLAATRFNTTLFFRYAEVKYGDEQIKDQPIFTVPKELFDDINALIRDYISLTFKSIDESTDEDLRYRKATCLRRDILRFRKLLDYGEDTIEQLDWSAIDVPPEQFLVTDYDLTYLDSEFSTYSDVGAKKSYFVSGINYRLTRYMSLLLLRMKFIERIGEFGLKLTTA